MNSTVVYKDTSSNPLPMTVEEKAIMPVKDISEAFSAYRDLQVKLDQMMPDQIMEISGKKFRKKGYWQAVATAFNLSLELVGESKEKGEKDWGFTVTYKASSPVGRSAMGDGSCFASEKSRGRMQATVHNVRAHAHTRAINRAISNLVGFGEVSADEINMNEKWSDADEDQRPESANIVMKPCPDCEAAGRDGMLSIKVGKKEGSFKGKHFWGCSAFPTCRFFKPYKENPDGDISDARTMEDSQS